MAKKAKADKKIDEDRKLILDKVKAAFPDAGFIEAHFSGSGDEGAVRELTLKDKDGNELDDLFNDDSPDDKLYDEVHRFMDDTVDTVAGGYGESEGGCGELTLDLTTYKGKINVRYYEIVESDPTITEV